MDALTIPLRQRNSLLPIGVTAVLLLYSCHTQEGGHRSYDSSSLRPAHVSSARFRALYAYEETDSRFFFRPKFEHGKLFPRTLLSSFSCSTPLPCLQNVKTLPRVCLISALVHFRNHCCLLSFSHRHLSSISLRRVSSFSPYYISSFSFSFRHISSSFLHLRLANFNKSSTAIFSCANGLSPQFRHLLSSSFFSLALLSTSHSARCPLVNQLPILSTLFVRYSCFSFLPFFRS